MLRGHKYYNINTMKSIKLHINKLGLVRDADLEITPMMVFSGESGLGKSFLAILCHYFFYVWLDSKSTRLDTFFKSFQDKRGINFFDENNSLPDSGEALSITKQELEEWLSKDAISYLGYMIGHDTIKGEIKVTLPESIPSTISFNFEQEMIGLNNAEDIYNKLSVLQLSYRFRKLGIQDESPYSYILRYAIINELFDDFHNLNYSFVLPPSRGSYMSEELVAKTGMYKSFVQGMKDLEQAQENQDTVSLELVKLLQDVLDGDVKRSGDQYIYITHGETLPISAAASSVREIAPMQQMITKRNISKAAVLIEEPESHLHPLKQIMMADIIATMAIGGANMQITTHSDYFIRRLNDLMRLHILKNSMDPDKYNDFCSRHGFIPDLTLNQSLLSAYYLERRDGGTVNVVKQNSFKGIPFDTFKAVNGKPLQDSSLLYELTADYDEL